MKRLWQGFRDLWCKPFGHVLYFPQGWKFWAERWECACSTCVIGMRGVSPWDSFSRYWRMMITPTEPCSCWGSRESFDKKCACRGRGWVRS